MANIIPNEKIFCLHKRYLLSSVENHQTSYGKKIFLLKHAFLLPNNKGASKIAAI